MKHILIAEQALRKSLPPQAEVHHVNGKRDDNRPENLVICEDVAYHRLLHMRGRALKACGNAHWRKCPFCKRYDDPCNMIPASAKGNAYVHQSCRNAYGREYFHRNKTISRLERKKMDTED